MGVHPNSRPKGDKLLTSPSQTVFLLVQTWTQRVGGNWFWSSGVWKIGTSVSNIFPQHLSGFWRAFTFNLEWVIQKSIQGQICGRCLCMIFWWGFLKIGYPLNSVRSLQRWTFMFFPRGEVIPHVWHFKVVYIYDPSFKNKQPSTCQLRIGYITKSTRSTCTPCKFNIDTQNDGLIQG